VASFVVTQVNEYMYFGKRFKNKLNDFSLGNCPELESDYQ